MGCWQQDAEILAGTILCWRGSPVLWRLTPWETKGIWISHSELQSHANVSFYCWVPGSSWSNCQRLLAKPFSGAELAKGEKERVTSCHFNSWSENLDWLSRNECLFLVRLNCLIWWHAGYFVLSLFCQSLLFISNAAALCPCGPPKACFLDNTAQLRTPHLCKCTKSILLSFTAGIKRHVYQVQAGF